MTRWKLHAHIARTVIASRLVLNIKVKEGLEMVEEKARYELGMVKPDEILVQVTTARR